MAIASGLSVDIFSEGALRGFTDTIAPLNSFTLDVGQEIAKKGESVTVGLYTAGGAVTTFAGNYLTGEGKTISDVKVTVSEHEFVTTSLTDIERRNTHSKIEELGYQQGADLADSVVADILGLVTNANFSGNTVIGAATALDSDDMIDLKNSLDVAKAPKRMRSALLAPAYFNNLSKDSALKNAEASGSTDALREGVAGRVAGFDIYDPSAIPGNSENLIGFGCVPQAIAIAMPYLDPGAGHDYSSAEALVDPDSGITMGMRTWYDKQAGKEVLTLECLWGKSVGITGGLHRLLSA